MNSWKTYRILSRIFGGKMINLDYGITYITGVWGASYWEGEEAYVYVVVAYNDSTRSVDTLLAIAGSAEYAAEGLTKQFSLDEKGYQIVSVQRLYDMLAQLEVSLG